LNIDNNASKDNDESSREGEGMVDENDAESSDPYEETISQTEDRRKGRPTLLKTGKPGGLKLIYQFRVASRSDPGSTSEILEKDDAQFNI